MKNNTKIEWKQVVLPQQLTIIKNKTPSQSHKECTLK